MGEVYQATDTRLGREVALKLLPAAMSKDVQWLERFEREARTVAALNHPNIVTIHSVEEDGGRHFLTMELVEGESLDRHIRPGGLKLSRLFELVIPIADALADAHAKGITHRDIKPANVMVNTKGQVKILDFGLAKLNEGTTQAVDDAPTEALTQAGLIIGTVRYMSPEQARGDGADPRSDVFSLGVLLYEIATGERPFLGKSSVELLSSILKDDPQPVTAIKRDLPNHLGRIVERCLEKDPERRYQTALGVRNELEGLRKEVASGDSSRPVGARGPARPRPLGWKRIAIALGGLAVVGLVGWWLGAGRLFDGGTAPSSPATVIDSLAVIPFEAADGDPQSELLGDGLAEGLIHTLSKLEGLHVVARTSAFRFKGRTDELDEIGEQLQVRALLTGRVTFVGDRIVVGVDLIDVEQDRQIWGQRYRRDVASLLDLQEEIVSEIVGGLRLELSSTDQEAIVRRETGSAEAYRAYLEGRVHWNRRTEVSLRRASERFERALVLDPKYALAWTGLADTHLVLADYGYEPFREELERSDRAVDRALELDPELGEAYASRGLGLHIRCRFEEAGAAFHEVLRLAPDYPPGRIWHAVHLAAMGRLVDANDAIEHAIELDPLSPSANSLRGIMATWRGDLEQGEALARRALELFPDLYSTRLHLAWNLEAQGRYAEALELVPTGDSTLLRRLLMEAKLGRRRDVEEELAHRLPAGDLDPLLVGLVLHALGRKEEAFEQFAQVTGCESKMAMTLAVEPVFDPVRSDSRFGELMLRLGFPEHVVRSSAPAAFGAGQ
jgi:TolB-like protein